jgi:hypothetical protein
MQRGILYESSTIEEEDDNPSSVLPLFKGRLGGVIRYHGKVE